MIIQATQRHAKALLALENQLFGRYDFPMSRGSFDYHIKRNDLYIYLHEGKVVGYILWLKRKSYVRLYSLGVDKAFRNQGIAEALLTYSFTHLNASLYTLEVKVSNSRAIRLYEKHGFTIQKVLKGYYPKEEDGYLMKRSGSS